MHFDWDNFLMGATLLGIIAHGVNSFPTPKNAYGQWVLGIIKFAVGQRISAMNAIRGNDTISVPVAQGTGASMQFSQSKDANLKVNEAAGTVTVTEDKKSSTTIPTGIHGTGTGE